MRIRAQGKRPDRKKGTHRPPLRPLKESLKKYGKMRDEFDKRRPKEIGQPTIGQVVARAEALKREIADEKKSRGRSIVVGSTAAGKDRVIICRGRIKTVAFIHVTLNVEGETIHMTSREFLKDRAAEFAIAIADRMGVKSEML